MSVTQEIIHRLLVAKGLLGKIRFLPIARPDRITLAQHILTAHDASELAAAAIAGHLGKSGKNEKLYLMDYLCLIKETHPAKDVVGRDFFRQLNQVRVAIKHYGNFPDPQLWQTVGERTWYYVSQWGQNYLGQSLDDLDESALIVDSEAKRHYDAAVKAFHRENYKETLEHLAFATNAVFESNRALRNLKVGVSQASDAIKLAAFGVHANDYLALQEFLPQLISGSNDKLAVKWEQDKYGHPANWTQLRTEFCLKTFVHVALRIQDADWIPGAIHFWEIYMHKITALVDGVEIFQMRGKGDILSQLVGGLTERVVVHTLRKGESLRGIVHRIDNNNSPNLPGKEQKATFSITTIDEPPLWGEVDADKVRATCVPKEDTIVQKYFPDLQEIDFDR